MHLSDIVIVNIDINFHALLVQVYIHLVTLGRSKKFEEAKCLFEKASLLDLELTFKILSVDSLVQFLSLSFDLSSEITFKIVLFKRSLLFV